MKLKVKLLIFTRSNYFSGQTLYSNWTFQGQNLNLPEGFQRLCDDALNSLENHGEMWLEHKKDPNLK